MKQLVVQNKYGAYSRPAPGLLSVFNLIEDNPNFDVLENSRIRLILGKCSRIADDEDLTLGRYGMDFHRAAPSFKDALDYSVSLPSAVKNRNYIRDFAFAAATEEEYRKKSDTYNRFYSYIYGQEPVLVFVAPHSGKVKRIPDDIIPLPEQETDAWAAGIAALCTELYTNESNRRIMVSVHSHYFPGPVIDVGDFGLLETARLKRIIQNLEKKYHDKLQAERAERADDTAGVLTLLLESIVKKRYKPNTEKPQRISSQDSYRGQHITRGLALHGIGIRERTLEGYRAALLELKKKEAIGIGYGDLYSGRHVSKLLGLKKVVDSGLLDGAIQIEVARSYGKAIPFLIAQIVIELINGYFFSK